MAGSLFFPGLPCTWLKVPAKFEESPEFLVESAAWVFAWEAVLLGGGGALATTTVGALKAMVTGFIPGFSN